MYNRRYEKVFLMLRQETAGYALGKRPPWGSCIMELKNGSGRLHFTAQGLKPMGYDVYVMAGEESIFCGEVQPEKKEGRCELKWDFDPDAVGHGKKAEDFHTVLFAVEGDSAPLTAYFKDKRDWKRDFTPREKTTAEMVSLQAAEAAVMERPASVVMLEKKEEPSAAAKEEDTNARVAEQQKESYHGSFQGLLAKFRQELEELEETGILSPEETERIRRIGTEDSVEIQERSVEKSEEKDAECGYLFGDREGWKQIGLEELVLLSQVPLKWQKEFFFLLPYRKYHHLLLKETTEGIWLGLPGRFNAFDAADAEAFGFHEFRKTKDDWGYWLCFLAGNG